MDIKLNQSVFCQLCDQLNAKSPSIYRLGKQYMLVNFLKIMVVLVMNVNKLLVKNYEILNFYHYLSNVQIESMCCSVHFFDYVFDFRGGFGTNRDRYVPNPQATSPRHIKLFEFLGQLMVLKY